MLNRIWWFITSTADYYLHLMTCFPMFFVDGVLPAVVLFALFGWKAGLATLILFPIWMHLTGALITRYWSDGLVEHEERQVRLLKQQMSDAAGCNCPGCVRRRGRIEKPVAGEDELQAILDAIRMNEGQ